MGHRGKSPLTDLQARRMLAEVSSADCKAARAAIAAGVQKAQDQWLEPHWIVDALAQELCSLALDQSNGAQLAAYLRTLADEVEHLAPVH